MSTEQNHRAVVIGAGLGGLCCGALLARHGVPVTIIEQHDKNTGFSVTVYDNAFEGSSQPGTSTLMLFCLSGREPWRRFEHGDVTGDRAAYHEAKERWSESLIRRAEERAWGNPGGGFAGALTGGEAAFTALTGSWAEE